MSRRSLAMLCALAIAAGVLRENAAADEAAVTKSTAKETAAKPEQAPAERPSKVTVGGVEWRTDYNAAYRAAKKNKRMLLINFIGGGSPQANVEQYIASSAALQKKLQRVERVRLTTNAKITINGKEQTLISSGAFAELQNGPGFVLIDLQNAGTPYYGHAVNVLPFSSGKYYHWQNNHLSVVLDLPPGTLTQRTMIWAVRTHPEGPASTYGTHHPTLANGAAQHSSYQASIGVQGHHQFESRYGHLTSAGSQVSEVVAESWPNQNMIDSCIDCVQSWRQSPGHWGGVVRRHRAFGYDIRRGGNGIWYGTGIFAD